MASLAEMERELTIERTRAGLEVARQLGRKGGRKRRMTDSKIKSAKKLLASGVPPREVAGNLGVFRADALSMDSSLHSALTYDMVLFLRGPLSADAALAAGRVFRTARSGRPFAFARVGWPQWSAYGCSDQQSHLAIDSGIGCSGRI
jgi:hypothetical protein